MSYIRWFHEINAKDVDLVGGKGANLGEMVSANLPVPPGFCLTAQAYREFINRTGLEEPIHTLVGGMPRILFVGSDSFRWILTYAILFNVEMVARVNPDAGNIVGERLAEGGHQIENHEAVAGREARHLPVVRLVPIARIGQYEWKYYHQDIEAVFLCQAL